MDVRSKDVSRPSCSTKGERRSTWQHIIRALARTFSYSSQGIRNEESSQQRALMQLEHSDPQRLVYYVQISRLISLSQNQSLKLSPCALGCS